MQKEYELTYLNVFKEDKNGKPYTSKNGKPFVRVSVKVAEHGNEYISGLWFGPDCPWKVGDKVTMEIKEEEYQGKKSLKFELPKKENEVMKRLEELENKFLSFKLEIRNEIKTFLDDLNKPKYPTAESEGLDPKNMANFDHTTDDLGPIEDNLGF